MQSRINFILIKIKILNYLSILKVLFLLSNTFIVALSLSSPAYYYCILFYPYNVYIQRGPWRRGGIQGFLINKSVQNIFLIAHKEYKFKVDKKQIYLSTCLFFLKSYLVSFLAHAYFFSNLTLPCLFLVFKKSTVFYIFKE